MFISINQTLFQNLRHVSTYNLLYNVKTKQFWVILDLDQVILVI